MTARGTIRWPAWGIAAAIGCGCGGGGGAPDASVGHDLSVALFQHAPFVDGDAGGAALVAIQDGDGAWLAVTGDAGVYRAHLAADRFGVAIGCRSGDSASVTVLQRAASDGLALRARACPGEPVELAVAVRHVPAGALAYVAIAGQIAGGDGDATYAFHSQPGPIELFAALTDASQRLTRLVRMPAFELAGAASLAIDFELQGAAPDEQRVLGLGGAGGAPWMASSVIRPGGEYALSAGAPAAWPTYQTLPTALWQPGDLIAITVSDGARSTTVAHKAPGATWFQLPPDVAVDEPAIALAPTLHPVFRFTATASELAVQRYVLRARTERPPDGAVREWTADLSAGWIASAGSVTYPFPDLSSATGPEAAADFALFPGPVRWVATRSESSHADAVDGRITRTASRTGAIVAYCGDAIVEPPETCDPPDGTSCSEACMKL